MQPVLAIFIAKVANIHGLFVLLQINCENEHIFNIASKKILWLGN